MNLPASTPTYNGDPSPARYEAALREGRILGPIESDGFGHIRFVEIYAQWEPPTCSTCKHWRHIRDEDLKTKKGVWPGPHGECGQINEWSLDRGAWLVNIDEIHDNDLSLITKGTFSCSEHESK